MNLCVDIYGMKTILTIFLFLWYSFSYSQNLDSIPNFYNLDLHIPKHQQKLNFYDFKYQMKSKYYYFNPGISNWARLEINAKFIFYTKNGIIILNIGIPGSPQSIFNGIKLN